MYANANNICMFSGRIAKDIESRVVGQGDKAFTEAKFTIAVDRGMSKAQKEKAKQEGKPTADFVQCHITGKQADNLLTYCSKGKAINVLASFESYSYPDKNDPNKKNYGYRFNVVGYSYPPSDASGNNNSSGNNSSGWTTQNNNNNNSAPANEDPYPIRDEDIPF